MQKAIVVSMKGGVRRTTTAIHLAAGFAKRARVLLVDGDPQGTVANVLRVRPAGTRPPADGHRGRKSGERGRPAESRRHRGDTDRVRARRAARRRDSA